MSTGSREATIERDDSDSEPEFKKPSTFVQFYDNLCKLPRVTLTASLIFTLVGFGSLYLGKQYYHIEYSRAIAWIVIGLVLTLPGFYALFTMLMVALQVDGFSLEDLPSYEEALQ